MNISELAVKEINTYYARHGGRRTAALKNFANCLQNVKLSQGSVARSGSAPAAAESGVLSDESKRSDDHSGVQSADSAYLDASCCEKCGLTNRLLLQMLSNNLYTQGVLGYSTAGLGSLGTLGYSAAGSGALTAYQSLSKYLGSAF